MKNKILSLAILFAFAPLLSVHAEGRVLVYPTIQINHGSTKFAKDIVTRIEYQNGLYHDSQKGVPTYSLSSATIDPVDYIVKFLPPPEYAYSIHGDCSGLIANTEMKTCYVDYTDNIPDGWVPPQNYVEPVAIPVITTSTPAPPQPVPSNSTVTTVPIFNGTQVVTDETAQIIALKIEIIKLLEQLIKLLSQQIGYQFNK